MSDKKNFWKLWQQKESRKMLINVALVVILLAVIAGWQKNKFKTPPHANNKQLETSVSYGK